MATSEWEIPTELQPDPAELGFDLDQALRSIVAVKAMVPADAFTAQTLGTERIGSRQWRCGSPRRRLGAIPLR